MDEGVDVGVLRGETDSSALDLSAATVIRDACLSMLNSRDEWLDEIADRVIMWVEENGGPADAEMRAIMRRNTASVASEWLQANVIAPGAPVPPATAAAREEDIRAVVLRGWHSAAVGDHSLSRSAMWRWWMRAVFASAEDTASAERALAISYDSLNEFEAATSADLQHRIDALRHSLGRGASSQARDAIIAFVQGDQVPLAPIERTYRYGLDAQHTAVIAWAIGDETGTIELERTVMAGVSAAGASQHLIIPVGVGTIWAWCDAAPDALTEQALPPGIQITVGARRAGPPGFRATHLDAALAQRFVARSPLTRRPVTFEEIRLPSMLATDPVAADTFARETLGDLSDAPRHIRETMLAHIRNGGNIMRTAASLHTHRNTVARHLSQAQGLLPHTQPDLVNVAAALSILRWRAPRKAD